MRPPTSRIVGVEKNGHWMSDGFVFQCEILDKFLFPLVGWQENWTHFCYKLIKEGVADDSMPLSCEPGTSGLKFPVLLLRGGIMCYLWPPTM